MSGAEGPSPLQPGQDTTPTAHAAETWEEAPPRYRQPLPQTEGFAVPERATLSLTTRTLNEAQDASERGDEELASRKRLIVRGWIARLAVAEPLESRSNHLKLDTWERLLDDSGYPHRVAVMNALRVTGCNVDMDIHKGLDEPIFQKNHLSSLVFFEGVEALIAKDLRKGNVVVWRGEIPPHFMMPVGANPKFDDVDNQFAFQAEMASQAGRLKELQRVDHEANLSRVQAPAPNLHFESKANVSSLRLLLDARQGLNARGPKLRFKSETIQNLIEDCPAHAYLWGEDLEGAFRNGWIPWGLIPLLGFAFNAIWYVYARLPFGARASPIEYATIFGRPVLYLLVWLMQKRDIMGYVMVFVDDFIGWGYTKEEAEAQRDCLLEILGLLGLNHTPEKSKPPSQKNMMLGFIVETSPEVCITVPERKLRKIRAIIRHVRTSPTVAARMLQSLAGCIEHVATGIHGARTFSQGILELHRLSASRGLKFVRLSEEAQQDLDFFLEEADGWNGIEVPSRTFAFPPDQEHASSDAMGAGGIAIALWGVVFVWNVNQLGDTIIQHGEMVAAVILDIALAAILGQPPGMRRGEGRGRETRVGTRIDNTNVEGWLKKGRATGELPHRLLRQRCRVLVRARVRAQPTYIESKKNCLADAGSRSDFEALKTAFASYANTLPREKPEWWPRAGAYPPTEVKIVHADRCATLGLLPRRLCGWDGKQELRGVAQVDELLRSVGLAIRRALEAE